MPLTRLFADDIRALRQGTAKFAPGSERERTTRLADRAARSALPVLIESEPGGGALALARAVHESGERRSRPFIRFDAQDMLDRTEDRGDALSSSLRDANGGTLFIQDVHHLSGGAQERLLEALSHPDTAHRAARRPVRSDARIVATAGFRLAEEVREGRLREDLYYRLQALTISLRPLRAQRDAIVEWAGAFMHRFAAEDGKRIRGLSRDAADLLTRYDWPGNLRQLENAVYRAVILADGPLLTAAEFPQIAARAPGFRIEIPPIRATMPPAPIDERAPIALRDPHALALLSESGEVRTLAELEAQAIRFALAHYKGQLSAASRHLGIGRSTLYRKLKELGLHDEAA